MGWGAAIGAVVGAVASEEARDDAEERMEGADELTAAQVEMLRRQGEISEEQYQFWLDNYRPLALEAISEARRDVVPDYEAITADNAGAYNAQRGGMERAAQRYGIRPNDGAFGAALSRLGGEEAKSLVYNRNRARGDAKGQKLTNLMGVYGMGSGMAGLAATTAANAGSGYGSAAGAGAAGAANMYGMANADAAGWGSVVSSVPWGQLWSGMSGTPPAGSAAATPSGSVGPTAGGYSYPAQSGGQPGPWAGGYNYTSSREAKENIDEVDPAEALDVVNRTPVRGYNYRGDNKRYVGTIAEDAPPEISDGKEVNLINQVGTLTAAVQELSKQGGGGTYGLRGGGNTSGGASSRSAPARAKDGTAPARGKPIKPGGNIGNRILNRTVPDSNRDGRRSGRDYASAIGNSVANYATGGLWGIGRGITNMARGRGWRGDKDPNRGDANNTDIDYLPASEPNNPYMGGQPWTVPNYNGPPTYYPQEQPAVEQPWTRPPDYANPGDRQYTPQELALFRQQEGMYRNDPSSIYYQGPRASDAMPTQNMGPGAHTYSSPLRELYNAHDVQTGSGQGFEAARNHYRALQTPTKGQQA